MMKNTLFIAILAALPAFAQQDAPADQPAPAPAPCMEQGQRPEGRPSREDFQKRMLEKYDTDKDGQLSDAEKEAMRADRQKRRQGKRPGMGGHKGPRGPHGQRPEGRPSREDFQKRMLEKYDTDKDGQLSDAEKEAMKADWQKRREGKRPGMGGKKGPRGGKGQGRGSKGPRGPQPGADVPVTLPL